MRSARIQRPSDSISLAIMAEVYSGTRAAPEGVSEAIVPCARGTLRASSARLCGEPLGAGTEHLLDVAGPRLELAATLAGLGEVREHPVGEQPLRVDAAGARGALALPDRLVVVRAEDPVQLADVADLGPAGVGAQDALGVGDHAHDLPADRRPRRRRSR